MSWDYRKSRLFHDANRSLPIKARVPKVSSNYERYDVDRVEQHLMDTAVFRRRAATLDAIGRISVVDCCIDGSYCRRANVAHLLAYPRYHALQDPEIKIDHNSIRN